jgi:hypothetical protein
MIQKILMLAFVAFFYFTASAQNMQVSGFVKDTATKANVKNAVVALLTPTDSVLRVFTRVKDDGSYLLKNVMPGKYILSVSHPNFGDFVDDIEIKSVNEKLAMISLTPKSKLLEAVIVKSGNPIRLKGDTTIYTADSFKVSANANVEELLKKMPGIQVDKNGKIKAMGQTVEKVLVDGEEFFGDDPGMAVKNLRADAVKEVQVFDKKSEQSEFTGIDDGKTQKTINLKLKEDKKKGYFGKVDLAGGLKKDIDDRYNDNILLSSFKGKRKITGFLLNGNTGQDGLNWQDQEKFGGGNDNMVIDEDLGFTYYTGNRGSADGEPYIDAQNGFITNVNGGIQYSNKWNEKTNVNFAPKYNSQRYNNTQQTFTQTQINDSTLNENSNTATNINRKNIKLKGIYEVKLDSNNTLKITANSNFYNTESSERKNAVTTGNTGTFKNGTNRFLSTKSDKQAYSGNAVFKHKFSKAKRTLSLTADWNLLENAGRTFLKSDTLNNFFVPLPNVNQMKDYDKATTNVSTKIVYTEPLSKNYSLELGYQIIINNGTNGQNTFAYTNSSSKYETKVDTLSNRFKQNITQNTPSAKINYAFKKFKINVGSGVSFTNFSLNDLTLNKTYSRNYTNFFPTARMTYTYKSNHNISINYNGSTKQPTIDQLQPLRNNNDQFNQYLGNPDLKPSFTNSFSINNNGYNFIKDVYFYQGLNVNLTENSITNNRIIDKTNGKTITQPINTNGNLSVNYYGGGGFKAKKINTRFNLNANVGYNKFADFINSQKSFSNNTNAGLSLYISKEKDKKYDISMNYNPSYNLQKTSQNNNKISYFTQNVGVDATIYYKKVWSINSNYDLNVRQKTAQIPGITNNLWNAKLQRTFKKDEFTIYCLVKDILNQNIGVDRNFYSNTFTETRNDRLKRYAMLGFTWNFKNKPPKAK